MADDPLAWTTTDRTIPYECPGFSIIRDEVTLPDGTESDFDYLSKPPSVVIIPFVTANEVVLIEEWRHAVERRNRGFPAGTKEPNDRDLAETAHRELREETGYVTANLEPLLTVEPMNGAADAVNHYFVATDCERAGSPELEADETITVRTTSYDRLLEAALAGEIRDGRTLLGLLYFEACHRL